MHTDVNEYDSTRGCENTIKESALKVYSDRKISCGISELNLHQWRAGPTLYQLSYNLAKTSYHKQKSGSLFMTPCIEVALGKNDVE